MDDTGARQALLNALDNVASERNSKYLSKAISSRALARLTYDERLWQYKCDFLGLQSLAASSVLANLENPISQIQSPNGVAVQPPPVFEVQIEEDDFGDFSSAPISNFDMLRTSNEETVDFVTTPRSTEAPDQSSKPMYRTMYIHAHGLLSKLSSRLLVAPHLLLSELFPPPSPPLLQQSKTLRLLSKFLSPIIQPLVSWPELRSNLSSAIDRFQASMLSAFESADSRRDERVMSEAAWASWESWNPAQFSNEWELGKVWAEKLEIFYEGGRWDPLENFTKDGGLAFEAMDLFMTHVLQALQTHGTLAVRVFPPDSAVLLAFADRLANEVIGEYITPLLSKARGLQKHELFLQATAATFAQSWRLVEKLLEVSKPLAPASAVTISPPAEAAPLLSQFQAEDVVFRMFESNMDEYLDEEIEQVKQDFEVICSSWERNSSTESSLVGSANAEATRFLTSSNPAQIKRTVLASFTNLMLLPVTIVPRTVGAVGAIVHTGGTAAVNGIAMLNPIRWGASSVSGYDTAASANGASRASVLFQSQEDDDEDNEDDLTVYENEKLPPVHKESEHASSSSVSTIKTASKKDGFESLQLLLSLDVALEIIHADRESLKRVETFVSYPGAYGHRVRETIEEIFILMLQALSERHVELGFSRAIEQMKAYNPTQLDDTERVAPLMQFFELVHVGDMIQSMVQVYFDKELAAHIDRTDFLNGVVREKKRFENVLDESVAAGLNTGTEVLMNQVEHIIQTKTRPREYYPLEGANMELKPTVGCKEVIACLQTHCNLLKGSTSKEVLEVFHQEIGLRLLAIVQKHLKRQIISLEGGFQVIADLNAYHAFITTLRVPLIAADFANLKMLGHVYIVEDAKDLAQIVRDVTRYGGAYRPEDIYEFIQRRSDWKKIEKTVDKAMYNLSFKEDCVVC